MQVLSPRIPKLVQHMEQNLEMVALLACHHVDQAVKRPVGVPAYRGADVLSYVQRSPVLAQKHLFVQLDVGQVHPNRAVLLAVENPVLQPLENPVLAQLVGVALVVVPVEADVHVPVGLLKPLNRPVVHHFPELEGLGVALLPFFEQFLGLCPGGGVGLFPVRELHVVVADQVVALDAGGLRSLTVSELHVGQHRLADVHPAVVDQVDLHHLGPVGLENSGNALSEAVVAHVPQMQGFVGVRAAELDHNPLSGERVGFAVIITALADSLFDGQGKRLRVDCDVQIRSRSQNPSRRPVRSCLQAVLQFGGNHRRSLFQPPGQGEKRVSQIPEFRFRRNLGADAYKGGRVDSRLLLHEMKFFIDKFRPVVPDFAEHRKSLRTALFLPYLAPSLQGV